MKRCVRYQLRSALVMVAAIAAVAAVVLVGNLIFGGNVDGGGLKGLLVSYLNSFPILNGIFMMVYGASLFSSYFDTALTMGARRRDIFWSGQVGLLVMLAGGWAAQLVIDLVCTELGWDFIGQWGTMPASRNWALLPVFLVLLIGGAYLGRIMYRKPVLGVVLMVLGTILCIGLMVAAIFISRAQRSGLWGDLFWLISAVSLVLFAVLELLLWREIRKAVIR